MSSPSGTVVELRRPRAGGVRFTSVREFRTFLAAQGTPLSDEQLESATAPLAPRLVVAGAGSGKTTLMQARVAWLVGSGQVAADRILGLTFTVKAAGELAGRVRQILAALGDDAGGDGDGGGEPTVLTYNAYAARLVAEHGLRVGVDPGAQLLSQSARYQLATRVLRAWRGPLPALAQVAFRTVVQDLVDLEAALSDHAVTTDELAEEMVRIRRSIPDPAICSTGVWRTALVGADIAAARRGELAPLVARLRQAKRSLRLQDFGDQVAVARRLAQSVPAVALGERGRWGAVLLDEYQDTSESQRALMVGLLGARNDLPPAAVTAVGDPNQAIYEWRGASAGTMAAFPSDFATADEPAPISALTVSRRSDGNILAVAADVARPLLGASGRALPVQPLVPPDDRAGLGTVHAAVLETHDLEGAYLVEQVRLAHDQGTPYREIAALLRTRAGIGPVYEALVEAGIPVEVVGLGGLLGVPDVAAVVAVLQALDDANDSIALLAVLTSARWRIGPRDLAVLAGLAKKALGRGSSVTAPEQGFLGQEEEVPADPDDALAEKLAESDPVDVLSLADGLDLARDDPQLSAEARRRVGLLADELTRLRRHAADPLVDLVHRVVTTLGLDVEVAADAASRRGRRSAALDAFRAEVAAFTDLDGEQSLTSFLAYLESAEEHERGLDASLPTGADAVQVLTIHKAKGLEWDVVLVPHLTGLTFPTAARGANWTTTVAQVPAHLRGDAPDLPAHEGWSKSQVAVFADDCKAHHLRGERRLLYVAVTRARHRLVVSAHRWSIHAKRARKPSSYFDEIVTAATLHGCLVDGGMAPEPPKGTENPLRLESGLGLSWPPPEVGRVAAAARELAIRVRSAEPAAPDGRLTPEERALVDAWDSDAGLLLQEARQRFAPERTVALPPTLSTTQALLVASDPSRLASALLRPMPRRPEVAALRGTRLHAWVERLLLSGTAIPLRDPDLLEDDLVDDARLRVLKKAFLGSRWATMPPHQVEAPFELVLGRQRLVGRIDAVYSRPAAADGTARWLVVDWKTGRAEPDPLQMSVYRLAWARVVGVPVEQVDALFVDLAHKAREIVPVLLDEAELLARLTVAPHAPTEGELLAGPGLPTLLPVTVGLVGAGD